MLDLSLLPSALEWECFASGCNQCGQRHVAGQLQDLACVDMAVEISERALEVVRSQIEAAAAAAKEAASHSLLLELEEEAAQQATTKKEHHDSAQTRICSARV